MPSIRKRGKSWELQWRERGRQIKRSLGPITEKDAKTQLAAKQVELRTGRNPLTWGPTLEAFAPLYLDWHARSFPSSHYRIRQIFESWLLPVFGPMPLDGIKPEDVETYITRREAKAETITKELRTLKAIINKAVEWERIDRNPIAKVKAPRALDSKPPRWFTLTELETLYSKGLRGSWWRFLVNTGLRRTEALQLKWGHITPDVIQVISEEGARTKNAKWRLVPLSKGALEALARIDRQGNYVFPRMLPRSFSRHFENDAERAGLDGSLHDLRHTFCSHLVMEGVALRTVQKLAGHSTIRVTERYAHLSPEHLQEAMATFSI